MPAPSLCPPPCSPAHHPHPGPLPPPACKREQGNGNGLASVMELGGTRKLRLRQAAQEDSRSPKSPDRAPGAHPLGLGPPGAPRDTATGPWRLALHVTLRRGWGIPATAALGSHFKSKRGTLAGSHSISAELSKHWAIPFLDSFLERHKQKEGVLI